MDVLDWLKTIIKAHTEFIFGFIAGMVIFVLISFSPMPFLLFLAVANILISGMVLVRINPRLINAGSEPADETGSIPCPECGSTRRHKKTCSIGKARREGHT